MYGDHVVIDGGELTLELRIDGGELSLSNMVEDGLQEFMPIIPDSYHGLTTVTPSQQTQVLQTAGLVVAQDITIGPIPSNYGLITWDGSTLMVS